MASPGDPIADTGSAGLSDRTTGGVAPCAAVVGNNGVPPAGADAAAGVAVDPDRGSAGIPAGSGAGSGGSSGTTAGGVPDCGVVTGNSGVPPGGAECGGVGAVCNVAGVPAGSVADASSSGRLPGVLLAAGGIPVSVSGSGRVATHSHRPLASMPHCQGSAAITAEYSTSNETADSSRMDVCVTTPGNSGCRGRSVLQSCH